MIMMSDHILNEYQKLCVCAFNKDGSVCLCVGVSVCLSDIGKTEATPLVVGATI